MNYDIKKIEKKWQEYWHDHKIGQAKPTGDGKKYYCLDMFPYPSGSGLHVGHWRGYVLSDVYARIKWLQGYNVLHPMGWDAFGLPAENDAIKKGIHPANWYSAKYCYILNNNCKKLVQFMIGQKSLIPPIQIIINGPNGFFCKCIKQVLHIEANMPINWCPSCLTGLANEEVVNGGCERCGTHVVQKKIRSMGITNYRICRKTSCMVLITLNGQKKLNLMQRNWIGKSEGIIFTAPVKDSDLTIQTFSAHFEACYADTFVVIAPDHPLLQMLLEGEHNMKEKFSIFAKN